VIWRRPPAAVPLVRFLDSLTAPTFPFRGPTRVTYITYNDTSCVLSPPSLHSFGGGVYILCSLFRAPRMWQYVLCGFALILRLLQRFDNRVLSPGICFKSCLAQHGKMGWRCLCFSVISLRRIYGHNGNDLDQNAAVVF
jgi:hypothetical protein